MANNKNKNKRRFEIESSKKSSRKKEKIRYLGLLSCFDAFLQIKQGLIFSDAEVVISEMVAMSFVSQKLQDEVTSGFFGSLSMITC